MLRTSHSPYQMRIQTHDSTLQSRSRRARGTPTSCVKRPNASDFTEPQGTSEPTRFSSMPSSTLQARCAGANSMYEPRGSAGAGANSMYGRSPVCKSLYEGVDSGGAPAACPICGRRHSTRARVLFGYVLDATLPLFNSTGGYIVFCGRRHSARARVRAIKPLEPRGSAGAVANLCMDAWRAFRKSW